jgi:hypothetical protein
MIQREKARVVVTISQFLLKPSRLDLPDAALRAQMRPGMRLW